MITPSELMSMKRHLSQPINYDYVGDGKGSIELYRKWCNELIEEIEKLKGEKNEQIQDR